MSELPEAPTLKNAFSWESQARQYNAIGPVGFHVEEHEVLGKPVKCLLFRDANGRLRGILNYYPEEIRTRRRANQQMTTMQRAQSCNIWVAPTHRRQGIATKLLTHALRMWPIPLCSQEYTPEGLAFVRAFVDRATQRAKRQLAIGADEK